MSKNRVVLNYQNRSGAPVSTEFDIDFDEMVQKGVYQSLKSGIFYEHETSKFLINVCEPGDVFVDVGANFGYFSLLAAPLVTNQGKVFAFDPNPRNTAALKSNLSHRDFPVIVEQVALSDRSGEMFFADCADNDTNGTLLPADLANSERSFTVVSIPLDEYFEKHRLAPPKIIKIDTEGAEMMVLRGASRLLQAPALEFVICEYNIPGLYRFNSSADELRNFMMGCGFDSFILDIDGGLPKWVPRETRIELPMGPQGDIRITNIVFARKDCLGRYWASVTNFGYLEEMQLNRKSASA